MSTPDYVVVARITPEQLREELREALVEAARLGIGEAIAIVIDHQKNAVLPEEFDPLITRLQEHSAAFCFADDAQK